MSDYLDHENLDEILRGHLASAWTGSPALYLQTEREREVEVHGNFALTTRGAQRFSRTVEKKRLWIDLQPFVEAFEIRTVFVANQGLFRLALEAFPDDAQIDVRRFVREGDCQARNSFGTADEKEYCSYLLDDIDRSERTLALLPVLGTTLAFGMGNFQFDEGMSFFGSDLKICHPLTKIANMYIPALMAQKELRRVVVDDEDLEAALKQFSFFRRYPTFLRRVKHAPLEVRANRAAIMRMLLARRSQVQEDAPQETGLFRRFLGLARERHIGASKPRIVSQSTGGRVEALHAFYSALETDDSDVLRGILASAASLEQSVSGGFVVYARSARAVAAARLAAWTEMPDLLALVQDAADHPCRDALVEWGTRAWIATGQPAGWLLAVTERDTEAIIKVAGASKENFDAVRRGLLDAPPDIVAAILPLETFEEEETRGKAARELYAKLRAEDDGARKEFFQTLDYNWMPPSVLRNVLPKARARWGESGDQLLWEVLAAVRTESYEEALPLIERWIALNESTESTANAYYWRGECLQGLKRYDESIEAYRKATEIDPTDSRPWREMGRSHWLADRNAEGEVCARKAYEIGPRASNAAVLAGLLFDQEKFAEYIELTAGLDDYDLKECRLPRRLLLSAIHVEEWSSVTQRIENLVPLMDDKQLSWFLEDATETLQGLDREDDVLAAFPQLLKDTSEYSKAANRIAECFFSRGRYGDAVALVRRCTKYPNTSVGIWCNLVDFEFLGEGNASEALGYARDALNLYPDCLFLLNAAGELADLAGGRGTGTAQFQRTVDLVAAKPDANDSWYSQYHRALAQYNLGDMDSARIALRRCSELSSSCDVHRYPDALVCLSCLDRDGAVAAYRKMKSIIDAQSPARQQVTLRSHRMVLDAYSTCGRIDPAVWQPIVRDVLGMRV